MEPYLQPEFWLNLVTQYKELGYFAPIVLAMLESFVPVLPLVLIITFNTGVYGFLLGFLFSYVGNLLGSIGVFFIFRFLERSRLIGHFIHGKRVAKIMHWVVMQPPSFLIVVSALPFTPSSFINIAFGLSGYSKRRYVMSIALGKFVMIGLLAAFGNTITRLNEHPILIIIGVGILVLAYYLSHRYGKLTGIEEPFKP